jgi:hypothetical protein
MDMSCAYGSLEATLGSARSTIVDALACDGFSSDVEEAARRARSEIIVKLHVEPAAVNYFRERKGGK